VDARKAGLTVPQPLIDRTVHRLEEMHLPTGAYLYGYDFRYSPAAFPAHMVPGSLGRTQVANLALLTWQSGKVSQEQARKELKPFFSDHAAIEMGRSGLIRTRRGTDVWLLLYFGHYYASALLCRVGGATAGPDAKKLANEFILPHQEADGSWWDYAMWDYHKPYGPHLRS